MAPRLQGTTSALIYGIILGATGSLQNTVNGVVWTRYYGRRHLGSVSGLAMSMQTACFEQYGYNPAHTLAHEFGHYLGLSHNLENTTIPGSSWKPAGTSSSSTMRTRKPILRR